MTSGRIALGSCVALVAALGVPAQSTTKVVEPNSGYEFRVPRWLEPFPVKPGDRQILVQLKGSARTRDRDLRGKDVEVSLMLVRIQKQAAPETGKPDEEESSERPEMESFTKQRAEHLNSGKNLDEFLERRGMPYEMTRNTEYFRKPLEDDQGREFRVYDFVNGRLGDRPRVLTRAFVVEDDAEIFGFVVFSAGIIVFERDIERIVRSLRPIDPDDVAGDAAADDPYADSELRDVEKRTRVRASLPEGWSAFDTENYILVTNVDKKSIVEDVLTDLEIMRAAYFERFPPVEGADMSAVSTVRLCDGYEDYLRYAGFDKNGTLGYWSPMEEELVLFNPERRIPKVAPWLRGVDPMSTLYHEAMHQYFHYSNRQLAPGMWFNEGYGEVFAGAVVDRRKGAIKELKPDKDRLKMIRAEMKRLGNPDLRMVMVQPMREFYGPGVLINYANAWSICYFLEMERQKPERRRNQAWAEFPDVYLKHLREVTARYRAKLPENAPDDWIMAYTDEIQREAVELALQTVDEDELEEAWLKEMRSWR